ncbi:MAG: hypothetical protein HKN22_08705 [Bacteroidia bacterium]|nr:hypothetical protein [Bacteroidia bacterium]
MSIIYYNGNYISSDEPLFAAGNRIIRYGDGVFESIAVYKKHAPLLEKHVVRINNAQKAIGIDHPISKDKIIEITDHLARENQLGENYIVNIISNRDSAGGYVPNAQDAHLIINALPLEEDHFKLNVIGKRMGIYRDNPKPAGSVSKFKTASSLLYVLAGKFCESNDLDDCIILNPFGKVAEAYSSNIFVYTEGSWKTPPLSSGCVSGMMRSEIIQFCAENGIPISEVDLDVREVYNAEEIFTSNAVRGIQWVGEFEGKAFQNYQASKLSNALNKKWGLK